MIIGKSKNPRALKNIDKSTLPVLYANQKKAWMDQQLFRLWFFDHFVPKVKAYLKERKLCKGIPLLDNAPSRPSTTDLQTPDGKINVSSFQQIHATIIYNMLT